MEGNGLNVADGVQPLTSRSRTSSVHVFDAVHAFDDAEGNVTKERVERWVREKKGEWRRRAYTYSFLDWMTLLFPCLQWLRNYSVRCLRGTVMQCHCCSLQLYGGSGTPRVPTAAPSFSPGSGCTCPGPRAA
jgi:hypothetical protein